MSIMRVLILGVGFPFGENDAINAWSATIKCSLDRRKKCICGMLEENQTDITRIFDQSHRYHAVVISGKSLIVIMPMAFDFYVKILSRGLLVQALRSAA